MRGTNTALKRMWLRKPTKQGLERCSHFQTFSKQGGLMYVLGLTDFSRVVGKEKALQPANHWGQTGSQDPVIRRSDRCEAKFGVIL